MPGNGHINGWYQPGSDRSGQERSHLTLPPWGRSNGSFAQCERIAQARITKLCDLWGFPARSLFCKLSISHRMIQRAFSRLRASWLIRLALVFGELEPETLLCVRNSLHRSQRNLELAIAEGTDSNGGNLTKPLDSSKIAFRHRPQFPTGPSPWLPGEFHCHHQPWQRFDKACA